MKKESMESAAFILAEIKALEEMKYILHAYNWDNVKKYSRIAEEIHFLGRDFGKPNATPLMTGLAGCNRQMLFKMNKIVDERIEELKKEFEAI